MTRGQIAAILPDGKLITSVEFNGGVNRMTGPSLPE